LVELATFKAILEGMRTYFLYEINYQKIAASDIIQHEDALLSFIAAVDGWEKRGIARSLFEHLDTVKIKLSEARKHFFVALGLLPPPGLPPNKQPKKRSKKESNDLFDAFDGLPNVLQNILDEFPEFKEPET